MNFIADRFPRFHLMEISAQLMKNSGGSPGELFVIQNQRKTQRSQVRLLGSVMGKK